MRPEKLKSLYSQLIRKGYSIIVLGPPGIGKSESVEQFVEELSRTEGLPLLEQTDFLTYEEFLQKCPGGKCVLKLYININTSLPVDLAGIPDKLRTADGKAEAVWIPMSFWLACRTAKYCIVVLDEFNATQNPDTLAMVMRLLSECRAGQVDLQCTQKPKLGGGTLVVALGNPPEMSSLAKGLPAPVAGGKAMIVQAEPPDIHDWIQYMQKTYREGWDRRIAGLLAFKPDLLSVTPPDAEVESPYPTPRGWTKSAVMCYANPESCADYIEGFCGGVARQAFEEFLKLAPMTIDDVLSAPEGLERELKLLVWTSMGGLCEHLREHRADSKMRELMQSVGPRAVASATFLASPMCPAELQKLYRFMPEEARRVVFATRYALAEKAMLDEEREIEEELL